MRLSIEHCHKIAKEKSGKCLSKIYKNNSSKLEWECSLGHRWEAPLKSIKKGHWCSACTRTKKLSIEEMQKIAESKNGKCLSEDYINTKTKLKWKCEKGHIWESTPGNVKHGYWCLKCSGREKLTIEEMQEIAKERGGKCLSNVYKNMRTKLKWECGKGHIWESTPGNIKRGSWCPKCSDYLYLNEEICRVTFEQLFNNNFVKYKPKWLVNSRGNKMELDGYCKPLNIAFEYNGRQHYDKESFFSQGRNSLAYRKEDDLKKIKLCKKNKVFLFIISYKDNIYKIGDLIKSQSILLGLDTSDLDFNKKIDYNSIYFNNASFSKLKEIVRDKNGKILSKNYLDSKTKLKFQCINGHIFESQPNHVKNGVWCSACAGLRKLTIEDMQKSAKSRNGKCLSKVYKNIRTKLKWECEKGHIWEATGNTIRRGHWCPECGNYKKNTIEEMHEIAKSRNGKCLSEEYVNANSKLKWECEKGHIWESIPNSIKRGTWCAICARFKKPL